MSRSTSLHLANMLVKPFLQISKAGDCFEEKGYEYTIPVCGMTVDIIYDVVDLDLFSVSPSELCC